MAVTGVTGVGCEFATPVGIATVDLDVPPQPSCLLVLGHGAGGGVDAPDLLAVRDLAITRAVAVARVCQPYRVAGRRAPAPAAHLDAAWASVIAAVRESSGAEGRPEGSGDDVAQPVRFAASQRAALRATAGLPLIAGGRSSGARVACRASEPTGAVGLALLAFPLHPPGRPERSRASELLTGIPTIVVNGDRDPFGCPEPVDEVTVEVVAGADHSLRKAAGRAAEMVVDWLADHGWAQPAP